MVLKGKPTPEHLYQSYMSIGTNPGSHVYFTLPTVNIPVWLVTSVRDTYLVGNFQYFRTKHIKIYEAFS